MERKTVIRCILAVVLLIYVCFAMAYTDIRASQQQCKGVKIRIDDPANSGFVAASDIIRDLETLKISPSGSPARMLDVQYIENALSACDNVERVNCILLTNDTLLIEVEPLMPLVRVFDRNDQDYFINRAGKQMQANVNYHIDVPVVTGMFSEKIKPAIVLPYVDFFDANPNWDRLVSALHVAPNGDIFLIPAIRGHVVNLGDTADIANKFHRLHSFYSQVMPSKGWLYYDTISVKWRGRVIASKRDFVKINDVPFVEENTDFDDMSTMNAGNDSLMALPPDNRP